MPIAAVATHLRGGQQGGLHHMYPYTCSSADISHTLHSFLDTPEGSAVFLAHIAPALSTLDKQSLRRQCQALRAQVNQSTQSLQFGSLHALQTAKQLQLRFPCLSDLLYLHMDSSKQLELARGMVEGQAAALCKMRRLHVLLDITEASSLPFRRLLQSCSRAMPSAMELVVKLIIFGREDQLKDRIDFSAADVVEGLAGFKSLKRLSLLCNFNAEKLPGSSPTVWSPLSSLQHLEHVVLPGLGPAIAPAGSDSAAAGSSSTGQQPDLSVLGELQSLQSIKLTGGVLDTSTAQSWASLPQLRSVTLHWVEPASQEATQALLACTGLTSLSCLGRTSPSPRHLAPGLSSLVNLVKLQLQASSFFVGGSSSTPENLRAFMESLHQLPNLNTLCFHGNHLCFPVAGGLPSLPGVTRLELTSCQYLGPLSAACLLSMLPGLRSAALPFDDAVMLAVCSTATGLQDLAIASRNLTYSTPSSRFTGCSVAGMRHLQRLRYLSALALANLDLPFLDESFVEMLVEGMPSLLQLSLVGVERVPASCHSQMGMPVEGLSYQQGQGQSQDEDAMPREEVIELLRAAHLRGQQREAAAGGGVNAPGMVQGPGLQVQVGPLYW